jgi:hypothetical protein
MIVHSIRHVPDFTRPVIAPPAGPPATTTVGPPPENASLLTKLHRVKAELKVWQAAGRPVAPKAVRKARLAFCSVCPYYQKLGNWGFGECHAPGCGCTRAKLWMATSRCPLIPPKWGPT